MPDADLTPAQMAVTEHLRLLLAGDLERWIELFAPQATFTFPFAPAGMDPELRGRDQLLAQMGDFSSTFSVEVTDLQFVPTAEPTTAVGRFGLDGTAIPTGKPYPQRCLVVVTVDEEGLITRFDDYWNPLVAAEALAPDGAAG